MKLRALTYFVLNAKKVGKVSDELSSLKLDLWSRRIALPPTSPEISISKLAEVPSNREIIYSLFHLKGSDRRLSEVRDLLKSVPNAFGSILLQGPEEIEGANRLLKDLEPGEATRLLLLLGEEFLLTPYFPAACAQEKEGIGVALLYVNDFKKGIERKALTEAESLGREAASTLRTEYLGVDPSLSPWMSESVGKIIEVESGRIFSPGNLNAVWTINNRIWSASSSVKSIGFSELMLPVGEDDVLKMRVEEGSLSLSSLLSLTSVCAAGLDMVAVGEVDISLILRDAMAIQRTKRRPYGVRLIPTGLKYGDSINIDQFGRIPIVKTL